MIESTLEFDAVGIVPDLLLLLQVVQRSNNYVVKKTGWETAEASLSVCSLSIPGVCMYTFPMHINRIPS